MKKKVIIAIIIAVWAILFLNPFSLWLISELLDEAARDTALMIGESKAYDAALKGKKPIIIEAQENILNIPTLCAANSNMLRELIRYHKIDVYTNAKLLKVAKENIIIEVDGEEKVLEVDTVVKSIGYNPSNKEETKNIHVIGDALKVGNLMDAIWKAYDLANTL